MRKTGSLALPQVNEINLCKKLNVELLENLPTAKSETCDVVPGNYLTDSNLNITTCRRQLPTLQVQSHEMNRFIPSRTF